MEEQKFYFQMEFLPLREAGTLLQNIPAMLSRTEQEKISGSCAKRQLEFLAGRICAKRAFLKLRSMKGKCSDIFIDTDLWGCPYVAGSNDFVSITHCDTMAAAVVSDIRYARIAVDMEQIRAVKAGAEKRFLDEEEQKLLCGEAKENGFGELAALCWSAKESAGKLFQYGFGVCGILRIEQIRMESSGIYEISFHGLSLLQVCGMIKKEHVVTMAAVFRRELPEKSAENRNRLHSLLYSLPID